MKEWTTKSVRDAFYATPKFPRLLNVEAVRLAIQNGVANGFFAYAGKTSSGEYSPFHFQKPVMTGDIEFSEEMFLIKKETDDEYLKAKAKPPEPVAVPTPPPPTSDGRTSVVYPPHKPEPAARLAEQLPLSGLTWSGEVPAQKWMNFYTKVLTKFAVGPGLKLKVSVEVKPAGGVSQQRIEETKAALRELGLNDEMGTA